MSALAQSDPCSSYADLASQNNKDTFVGFGAGSTQKEADNNAQIDMASRIRSKITATSTVTENNTSSNLESTSKSVVSESLVGAKVLRRCPNKDSFSSVFTLDKSVFVRSLENKLSGNVTKATKYIDTLTHSKNDQIIAQNIDGAKKFIADYQATFEDDLQLCKIYSGCGDIKKETVFSELADVVAKLGDKDQYVMVTDSNDVTEMFRDDLVSLVEQDGIKVMDGAVSENAAGSKRKILAKCNSKMKPKIPHSSDRIVETTCVLESYIGKQKGFRKVYSCSAMLEDGASTEDAVNSCSGRLELQ
jgi:hypothetical protein